MSFFELKSLLEKYNQKHLLQFWDEISEKERKFLIEDINNLNLSNVTSYFHRAVLANKNKLFLDTKVKPVSNDSIESLQDLSIEKLGYYESIGLQEIANGNVGIILLAGGQGTRLGVDFPKGMYNINLPSKRTLFHLQALKLRRLQNFAKQKFSQCKDIIW